MSIVTAFDHIRLIRRKICIMQDDVAGLVVGTHRDSAIADLHNLKNELAGALQDFADLGYEEDIAQMITPQIYRIQNGSSA